jgi:hypothetical protein
MRHRTTLLLLVYFGFCAGQVIGQTIPPPDLLSMDASAKTVSGDTPETLSADESRARLSEAIQNIAGGQPDAALQVLSAYKFDVPDGRVINVLRAACYLGKRELRKALDETRAADAIGQSGNLGALNAANKARVFGAANILPLSYDSAAQAQRIQPGEKSAAPILEEFAKKGVGGYSRAGKFLNRVDERCEIELWRGTAAAPSAGIAQTRCAWVPQPVQRGCHLFSFLHPRRAPCYVLTQVVSGPSQPKSAAPSKLQPSAVTLTRGDTFLGAFALEPIEPAKDKAIAYELTLNDLEGRRLPIKRFESQLPTEKELLQYAGNSNPTVGKGGYTVMRAENEAAVWGELTVTPFAALWAQYAIQNGGTGALSLEKALAQRSLSKWNYEGRFDAGHVPDPKGGPDNVLYTVAGYANAGLPSAEELQKRADFLEIFHFPLLARGRESYKDSYVVISMPLTTGDRGHVLVRMGDGNGEIVHAFPQLPSYQEAAESVREELERGTQEAIESARKRLEKQSGN